MQLTAQFAPLAEVPADYLIVGLWEEEPPTGSAALLDARLGGVLARLRYAGDISGKAGELTHLLDRTGAAAERLLIVGLGKRDRADRIALTEAAATAMRAVTGKSRNRVAFTLPEGLNGLGLEEIAQAVGVGMLQGCHGPGVRKSEPQRFAPKELWQIAPPSAAVEAIRDGARRADAIGHAVALAQELVNLPPNDLYPETFAERARQAFGSHVECTVLDEKQIEAERMGALLAVARGSDRPPRLLVLRYRGADTDRPLGWIGKGVTFDSGGLSLKTNEQMLDMKGDMAGAAAVVAAIQTVAELHLPVNILGVCALVENMPGSRAMKLGDVLRARNGKTIEVHNTDAEGRLILADALSYAVDHRAGHLVDLATLTGACMVALGEEVAGLMGNNDGWCEQVLAAVSGRAGERVWRLPMFQLFGEQIKSQVADIKNVTGKRYGGAITAAKFLEHFVGEVPWVHLDIAGPAWADHESPARDSGGTGFAVRTLIELAREYK